MDSEINLSIVVPTYKRPDNLDRFLNAVVHQITPGRSLIIVNDGSHDNQYVNVIKKYKDYLTYLTLPSNQGPAAARNVGAKISMGNYIIFTDDDCIPPPDWLNILSDYITVYPEADLIGGPTKPLLSEKPSLIEQFLCQQKMYPQPSYHIHGIYCLPTANFAIKRDLFIKMAGFDERFKLAGGEDLHLTQKIKTSGATIHIYDKWVTNHWHSGETLISSCKRYYRHGMGTSQHVILSKNNSHSRHENSKNLSNAILSSRKNLRLWCERYGPISAIKLKFIIFSIFRIQIFICHEISWLRGLKAFKKLYPENKNKSNQGIPPKFSCWTPETSWNIDLKKRSDISVTVIVSTYKRPNHLRIFLNAIMPQLEANEKYSLVVSNDGSHNKEYEEVVKDFEGIFDYVSLPLNVGRGPARNAAAKRAKGEFLVFTDDDCIPPLNWLDRVVRLLEKHPDLVAVGGGTLPVESLKPGLIEQYSLSQFLHPKPLFSNGQMWCMVTASLAVRRDWFIKLGGMNEKFKASDDLNLTYRLRKAGVPIFIDRHWITYHPQDWTLGELWERFSRYGYWVTHHAILAGDPIADANRPNDSIYDFFKELPSTIRETVKIEFRRKQGFWVKISFVCISVLKHIAWHYGGIRGSRHAQLKKKR